MIEDIKYLCNEVIIIKSGQILKVAHSNEIASLASGRVYKIPERELSNLKSPFYIENYLIRDNEKNEKIVKVLLLGDISNMEKYSALIPTGHAGIIWTSSTIVESLSNGVTTGPNDWNTSKTSCYGISVKGTTVDEDNEASNWCYRQLGKPYNYNYFNVSTRKKFYCSQLVWAAFKDNYGIDLDTSDFGDAVHPMELVNSSKTYTIYKK